MVRCEVRFAKEITDSPDISWMQQEKKLTPEMSAKRAYSLQEDNI